MRKQELRFEIEKLKQALDHEWVHRQSVLIQDRLIQHPLFQEAGTIGCYAALPDEVETAHIRRAALAAGKKICIPAHDPTSAGYVMSWIHAEDELQAGKYQVPEPGTIRPARADEVELMLVPAVACDRKGNRLGRGKGYYDRILESFTGNTCALLYDFQLIDSVPGEAHDVRMKYILTPEEFFST